MKKILALLFLLIYWNNNAQNKYPSIINFDVNNKIINDKDEVVWATTSYHFLMINPHIAIDLNKFGNKECKASILATNANKIILEFNQPSKLIRKGMCAAGLEKGFIYLELNEKFEIINSSTYLIESCLLSIETINIQDSNYETVTYDCENLQTSESFTIAVNTKDTSISKKRKE